MKSFNSWLEANVPENPLENPFSPESKAEMDRIMAKTRPSVAPHQVSEAIAHAQQLSSTLAKLQKDQPGWEEQIAEWINYLRTMGENLRYLGNK